jgi:hypothetical protein
MSIVIGLIFAVVLVMVFSGFLWHFLVTGSLMYVIQQRIQQHLEQTRPKPCAFCGGIIPAGAANCSQCGGPRAAASPSESPTDGPSTT